MGVQGNGMFKRAASIAIMLLVVVLGLVEIVSHDAKAVSGTITVAPGETKYVSFDTASTGDLLLWSLTIDTWSTIFQKWLETPGGGHVAIQDVDGYWADADGVWRLGFSIDPSGWWSATVSYGIYQCNPSVTIASPADGTCVDQPTILVSGTTEGWADKVEISIDNVHWIEGDMSNANWNIQITLPEGTSTIIAKETIIWGGQWFSTTYGGRTIVYDKTPPAVGSLLPSEQSKFRKDNIWLSWQGADSLSGIDHYEVKIDDGLWVNVDTSTSYHFSDLQDGWHTYYVRAYDRAGNYADAGASVKTTADALSIDGPYYGIPLIAIIIAVILVAVFVVLKFVRKPKLAPPAPPAEPPLENPPASENPYERKGDGDTGK